MFSIVQTMVALSASSRITSYSSSCQPRMDSSMSTCEMRELRNPSWEISTSSPMSRAVPPPKPPNVKAGRMRMGQLPMSSAAAMTSSMELQATAWLMGRLIDSQTLLNNSRSSALSMASKSEPMSSTPRRSRVPLWESSLAMLRAVCPPMPARSAHGRSFSRILAMVVGSNGSM